MKNTHLNIGIVGAGAMGAGIAQVAAAAGHKVHIFDLDENILASAKKKLEKVLNRLIEKKRITTQDAESLLDRISWVKHLKDLSESDLIIEAIVENLSIKKSVFSALESLVNPKCILASNTSSLSIAAISSACKIKERVMGIHFFNPAPLMPLVEVIPAIGTDQKHIEMVIDLMKQWGKIPVEAKDTPGFIVNRIARPFYGEALRIYEEGWEGVVEGPVGFATIDWAMREIGGFRMGPFELMDYIGNDVNFAVTESVFTAFFYDPRYRPAITQKRYSEAGWFGRKSGRGYYDYSENTELPEAVKDAELGQKIVNRILCLLINEAVDALYLRIANAEDIELAMTRGVNYPKGLLKWGEEIGYYKVLDQINMLHKSYAEDRYRPSQLLIKWANNS
jgi:3-hydroxybutyryl-CoA dehydrogenase